MSVAGLAAIWLQAGRILCQAAMLPLSTTTRLIALSAAPMGECVKYFSGRVNATGALPPYFTWGGCLSGENRREWRCLRCRVDRPLAAWG